MKEIRQTASREPKHAFAGLLAYTANLLKGSGSRCNYRSGYVLETVGRSMSYAACWIRSLRQLMGDSLLYAGEGRRGGEAVLREY